jgi:S-layer homology domain
MRFARIFTAVLLVGASAVSAQVVSATGAVVPPEPSASLRSEGLRVADNTYGTSALTWVTFTPWEFHPRDSSTTYAFASFPTYGIYNAAGPGVFEAGLHLPEGAVVSVIELAACDSNAAANLSASFLAVTRTGTFASAPGYAGTTGSGGCQDVSDASFTPWIVNNDTAYYTVEVVFQQTGPTLLLNSVRVGYKLQVSPPPGTATFGDVPTTHLFFQYVEALAAAGITSGCGGGNFCPDAAVTRGQMAVFLAKALGLHWAP